MVAVGLLLYRPVSPGRPPHREVARGRFCASHRRGGGRGRWERRPPHTYPGGARGGRGHFSVGSGTRWLRCFGITWPAADRNRSSSGSLVAFVLPFN